MKTIYKYIMYACAMAFAGCSSGDDVAELTEERNPGMVGTEVAFATEMDLFTRAHGGAISDLDALKATTEGFGVFAYLTGSSDWTEAVGANAVDAPAYPTPDFMMNQQVTWGAQYSYTDAKGNDVIVRDWVYRPLKYWPNGTTGTDDPLTTDGNTDATNPQRVSFFAYAPHADGRVTDDAAAATLSPEAKGVISYARTYDKSPHVWYVIGDGGAGQIDLLWANCIDARRNRQGLIEVDKNQQAWTYQRVPLQFKHALSSIDIFVQRIYDEQVYSGKTIFDPVAKTKIDSTKLFVSRVKLTAADGIVGTGGRGRLSLVDGTWTSLSGKPGDEEAAKVLTIRESLIEDSLRGTLNNSMIILELDRWPMRGYGVDENERRLLHADSVLTMIPQTLTLTPEVTYSMVTQDNSLLLNDALKDSEGNLYSRIVNTLVANPVTITFEPGKRYKLLLRIGVEHLTFEVLSVVDWDFPLRFNPYVVSGYTDETLPRRIDEE